jgi:hypothetical protein
LVRTAPARLDRPGFDHSQGILRYPERLLLEPTMGVTVALSISPMA